MTRVPTHPKSPAALAALVALLLFRIPARAEDSLAYKFENYREADGRITVQTQSSAADQDLGQDMHLHLTGTIDAITGATPTGAPAPAGSDQVPLTHMVDRRKAWAGDLSRQFGRVGVDAGFADSRESDYVSNGWSVNTQTDFNQKNTTLLLGVAGTSDRVEAYFEPGNLPKHSASAIAGVTQLINPLTFVTVDLSWDQSKGFLNDQHKLVEKTVQIIPGVSLAEAFAENRPAERKKETGFVSVNRAFPGAHGAMEAGYRYYQDTFGVTAHTLEVAWIQHLGTRFRLEPSVRAYRQGAADFYFYDLDQTAIKPVRIPHGVAPYYSSDYRLSEMDSLALGLKATWVAGDHVQFEVAYQDYHMRGRDGVTPESAYPRAGITTAGAKIIW